MENDSRGLAKGITKLGINFNGNLDDEELVKRAKIVKKSGINVIWIGEFEGFKDPFYVAELISDFIDVIGFGILSPLKRDCEEILKTLRNFRRIKDKIIVGIAPGKFLNARMAVDVTVSCMKYLKKHLEAPVIAGCSSPLITKKSSEVADGILFNYVKAEYIRWIKGFMGKEIFTAAYGPSLVLPEKREESEFYESLLIASSIVIPEKKFVERFELQGLIDEIKKIDFDRLIEIKHSIGTIKHLPEYGILQKHSDFLLENFTISGKVEVVAGRIEELLKECEHVILSDPFFRDDYSMSFLGDVVKIVENG